MSEECRESCEQDVASRLRESRARLAANQLVQAAIGQEFRRLIVDRQADCAAAAALGVCYADVVQPSQAEIERELVLLLDKLRQLHIPPAADEPPSEASV